MPGSLHSLTTPHLVVKSFFLHDALYLRQKESQTSDQKDCSGFADMQQGVLLRHTSVPRSGSKSRLRNARLKSFDRN